MRIGSLSLARLLAGLFALLGGEFASPAAHASCGSHVLIGNPSQPDLGTMPVRHEPCSGPLCSRGDETPPLPTPQVVPLRTLEACLLAALSQHQQPPTSLVSLPTPKPMAGPRCAIYHPPR